MTSSPGARPDDLARVTELLGRRPRASFEVVVRGDDGDPIVIRNAPILDDGTPMPTLYWLCGPDEIRRIGELESGGGVDRAEREVDPDELAAAHARYAAERDALIPPDHGGHRPTGGVGGTREGVKCLHAHWAWYLAGGDDPVGRWIERELGEFRNGVLVEIGPTSTRVVGAAGAAVIPWGPVNLTGDLIHHDPARPEELTNAIGAIADPLDDAARADPSLLVAEPLRIRGADGLVWLEAGHRDVGAEPVVRRRDIEEVFRMISVEDLDDRGAQPGLGAEHAGTILATACTVVAVLRRLGRDDATFLIGAVNG